MKAETQAGVDWREEFWDFPAPAEADKKWESRVYLDCAAQGIQH